MPGLHQGDKTKTKQQQTLIVYLVTNKKYQLNSNFLFTLKKKKWKHLLRLCLCFVLFCSLFTLQKQNSNKNRDFHVFIVRFIRCIEYSLTLQIFFTEVKLISSVFYNIHYTQFFIFP